MLSTGSIPSFQIQWVGSSAVDHAESIRSWVAMTVREGRPRMLQQGRLGSVGVFVRVIVRVGYRGLRAD